MATSQKRLAEVAAQKAKADKPLLQVLEGLLKEASRGEAEAPSILRGKEPVNIDGKLQRVSTERWCRLADGQFQEQIRTAIGGVRAANLSPPFRAESELKTRGLGGETHEAPVVNAAGVYFFFVKNIIPGARERHILEPPYRKYAHYRCETN